MSSAAEMKRSCGNCQGSGWVISKTPGVAEEQCDPCEGEGFLPVLCSACGREEVVSDGGGYCERCLLVVGRRPLLRVVK